MDFLKFPRDIQVMIIKFLHPQEAFYMLFVSKYTNNLIRNNNIRYKIISKYINFEQFNSCFDHVGNSCFDLQVISMLQKYYDFHFLINTNNQTNYFKYDLSWKFEIESLHFDEEFFITELKRMKNHRYVVANISLCEPPDTSGHRNILFIDQIDHIYYLLEPNLLSQENI